MNTNQRNEANNQSDNGGNEKATSSGRTTADKGNLGQSQQSGGGASQQGGQKERQGQQIDPQRDRSGSQQQGDQGQRQSLDPSAPPHEGKRNLSADEDMDDDTGLSNTANRQSAQQDQRNRQMEQSNVGRRDDGTPD